MKSSKPSTSCFASSNPRLPLSVLTLSVAAVLIGGCGTQHGPLAARGAAERAHVGDAHLQRASHHAELRFDAITLDLLARAEATDDVVAARQLTLDAIERGFAQGRLALLDEIDRLDEAQRVRMIRQVTDAAGATLDEAMAVIDSAAEGDRSAMEQQLAAATDARDVHRIARSLRRDTEASIKTAGRVGRAAPWALFYLPMRYEVERLVSHEYAGPQEYRIDHAAEYLPDSSVPSDEELARTMETAETWQLLQQFAPRLVQEIGPDPANDVPSAVVALSDDDAAANPLSPTIYAYSRYFDLAGEACTQLTYVWWFREQPALKPRDFEKGKWDGATFRITLDATNQPLIYETVDNCGCYHRIYPTADLEARAVAQFGEPQAEKHLSLEKAVDGKIDLMLPKTIDPEMDQVTVRARAQWHGIIDLNAAAERPADEIVEQHTYALRPYHDLEHLPLPGGGYTSLFAENGLVKHAWRLEGIAFTPIGILSAGQPRQRGTQLLQFDQYDMDDPNLFPAALRWPAVQRKVARVE